MESGSWGPRHDVGDCRNRAELAVYADGCLAPWLGGGRSGCDTKRSHLRRRGTCKDLDAPEWTPSTVGAEPEPEGQEVEEQLVVVVGLRLRGDGSVLRLSECAAAGREQTSPTAVGEEPVVTDTHEAFGEMDSDSNHPIG